jgi:hypothetical protein
MVSLTEAFDLGDDRRRRVSHESPTSAVPRLSHETLSPSRVTRSRHGLCGELLYLSFSQGTFFTATVAPSSRSSTATISSAGSGWRLENCEPNRRLTDGHPPLLRLF